MFGDDSLTAAQRRVNNSLTFSLEKKYGKGKEVAEEILKIHGLHHDNFDFIKNIEELFEQGITDLSIDQNSNKNEVTIPGIFKELTSPVDKLVGYRYLYRKMKDLYGKNEAKRLSGEMYDFSLAISDSTKINLPYCWAMDASKIVTEGRPFGQLKSAPPKSLTAYTGALNETVHQLSNHLAGAIAVGSYFLDLAHIIIYKEKNDHLLFPRTVFGKQERKQYRKYVENNMQSFVHSVNHLSRNAMESPFTNVSVFDSVKVRALLAEDEMGWYFDTPKDWKKSREAYIDYVVDVVMKLQDIYMDFFDRGDPLGNGAPYRFPVTTVNISKSSEGKIIDRKFVKFIAKHEIYRYNILVSEGSQVSSCCFEGDEPIEYSKDGKKYYSTIKAFVDEKLSGGSGRRTLNKSEFITNSKGEQVAISGVMKIPNETGKLIDIELEDGRRLSVTPDQLLKAKKDGVEGMFEAQEILKDPSAYDL